MMLVVESRRAEVDETNVGVFDASDLAILKDYKTVESWGKKMRRALLSPSEH